MELTKESRTGESLSDTGNHLAKGAKEGRSKGCSGYWKEAIVLREVRIKRSVLLQNDCQRVSDCRLVLLSRAEEESRPLLLGLWALLKVEDFTTLSFCSLPFCLVSPKLR